MWFIYPLFIPEWHWLCIGNYFSIRMLFSLLKCKSPQILFIFWKGFEELTRLGFFFFHSPLPSEKYCAIRANNITHLKKKNKVKRATYSWVQSSGVAGVVVTLALRVRAAVDSDSGAGGELVAAGAQRRVWRRRPGVQTAGQWAGCHQELLAQSKNNSRN